MHDPTELVVIGLVVAVVLLFLHYLAMRERVRDLPPGPRRIPIIGNAHQLPTGYLHKTFHKWAKLHGDIIYARFLGFSVLILDSLPVAKELLDRRGSKYSGRPHFTMMTELIGWERATVFLPYDKRWRLHRQWIQAGYGNPDAMSGLRALQRREIFSLLSDLCGNPGEAMLHFKRYNLHLVCCGGHWVTIVYDRFTGALILETAYGCSLKSRDDNALRKMLEVTEETSATAGVLAATLADLFPALVHIPTWMPGAGFKRRALQLRKQLRQVVDDPFQKVKRELAVGTARKSFVASLLQDPDRSHWPEDYEEEIKGTAAVLYGAGLDTSAIVLSSFLLAMVLHPEVYREAQEEIDRVVGKQRLPEPKDRSSLPFLECVLKEVYRWNPPLPLGITHTLTVDDEYRGYSLPRRSMVMPNIWAMMRDETVYPNPDTFDPKRFVNMDSKTADATDPRRAVFGFGRRICPGRHFADVNTWFAIANITAALDIRRLRDADSKELIPTASFAPGIASYPAEFKCDIRPRSERSLLLISELNNATLDESQQHVCGSAGRSEGPDDVSAGA